MKHIELRMLVAGWFELTPHCGLILPDGWFGRPYDNCFFLETVEFESSGFFINFYYGSVLKFNNLKHVFVEHSDLIFDEFDDAIFSWGGGAGTELQQKRYGSGRIQLVAPIGSPPLPRASVSL